MSGLTMKDLDQAALHGCQMCGEEHAANTDHPAQIFIRQRCHPHARIDISYMHGSGTLRLECAECHAVVVNIAVRVEI